MEGDSEIERRQQTCMVWYGTMETNYQTGKVERLILCYKSKLVTIWMYNQSFSLIA